MKNSLVSLILGFALTTVSPAADAPFVEYGEYISTQTVFGGMVGYWSGNNQDQRFISNGRMVYSSKGGWVAGAQNGSTPAHVREARAGFMSNRAVNTEFGEYVSQQTVFGGMTGYWSGNNQDQRFISNGQMVYSSKGGWVAGAGPLYAPGPLVSQLPDEDVSVFLMTDNAFIPAGGVLLPDRLYLLNHNRTRTRTITRAFVRNARVELEMRHLRSGTVVYGSMLGKTGLEASYRYRMENDGRGIQWYIYGPAEDPLHLVSVKFVY